VRSRADISRAAVHEKARCVRRRRRDRGHWESFPRRWPGG